MRRPYTSLRRNGGSKLTGRFLTCGPARHDHRVDPDAALPDPPLTPDDHDRRSAGYQPADARDSVRGNRAWWDAEAEDYRAEHLGHLAGRLVWGPEGLDEADAGLLGEVAGRSILEVGAGSGDCSGWLRARGGHAVATDLSAGMLRLAPSATLPRVQCDARALPFADGVFDLSFSAYGAVPFVADPEVLFEEVARVLRPGGRWVFSITHPIRWAFPDDPGPDGLQVTRSYFDRTPYVETAVDGSVAYAEHHRTLGDRVRSLMSTGFQLIDLIEPEWPQGLDRPWGAWSPLRGGLIPGTAIFVCARSRGLP
jgi:SAM-dependent methyltransferase